MICWLRNGRAVFALLPFAALVFESPAANAQDGVATTTYSIGVGGSVGIRPKYEGSKEYEAYGFPLILPKLGGDASAFAGRVKFRGIDDVRIRAFDAGGFEIGPLAGYVFGRDEDDGDKLLGLGKVDDGLVLGAYAGYRLGIVMFDVSYHQIVTGNDDGYQIRAGAEVESYIVPGVKGVARVGTTFADDNYMDSYFGVNAVQASNSIAGLPVYDAGSGIKDVHFGLATVIDLTDRWKLRAGGKYARLLKDAADSPVIETKDQFSAIVGLSYRFDFQR
jgi:outer membrane protein